MSKLKGLKLKQLSNIVREGRPVPMEKIGRRLRDIREALGMTQKQLARRIGIRQPLLSRIEDDAESCSLKTVVRIARAMDCDFFGAFISSEKLEAKIRRQAAIRAKSIIERTFSNMAMERQAPENRAYEYQLKQLTEELVANPGPELWEE